jgi:hypothetical protein
MSAGAAEEPLEPLQHVGIVCLQEEPLASQFAERLAAQGNPLFYIRDIEQGISQGDIIRFRDKAVLIDADVWQTLMTTGVLKRLKNIPVLTLTARAQSAIWNVRSTQVAHPNESKGYVLGRELLKIFDDYFGSTPSRMELVIRFQGSYMTMVVPDQLLSELSFVNVMRQQKTGEGLRFITTQPPHRFFVSRSFSWTVWAVDAVEPSGLLQYTCMTVLPPGCAWNGPSHTISGTPLAAGIYPFRCVARNSSGQSAVLACTLSVVSNTPPRIQARFDEPVGAGSRWEYTPFIADAEHALDELAVRLFDEPPGMVIDPRRKTIVWNVPPDIQDTVIQFVIGAMDPLLAITKEKMAIHVQSPALARQNITIDFRLPLDTMIQGHVYGWPDDVWMKAVWREHAVRLASIEGDDSTCYRMADGVHNGRLTIKPMRQGIHAVAFTFFLDTARLVVRKTFIVLPNRPPVFRSRLTASDYDRNQVVEYTPVVTDEDGDSLSVAVVDAGGNVSPLVGGVLRLPTGAAGEHSMALTATDPFGNAASQQIIYSVKLAAGDPARRPYVWYLRKTSRRSGDVGFACGGFRIGLYSADVSRTLTHRFLGLPTVESPFLFVGANPLGDRQLSVGNYLYLDFGVNCRMYGDRIYGGGVLGRVQADYCRDGTSPWRFQTFFALRLKQIFFFIDTVGLGNELTGYTSGSSDSRLSEDVENLIDIFDDYGRVDNFGIYLHVQTLYRFPGGFWVGPSAWIEDDIMAPDSTASFDRGNFFVQYTGLCFMHEWRFKWLEYSQQLHVGWRGNSARPKVHWDFTIQAVKMRR